MATIQSNVTISTYQDAIESILDSHDIGRDGLNERRARSSLRQAYIDTAFRHSWSYYYRQRLLQSVAEYSTGTIDFDYSGGTYELQLTLASGTWPSWAAFGHVIIDDVHYDVDDRKSDSVITLTSSSNPGADVAAGTTYSIYRSAYPLPSDCAQVVQLWDVTGGFPIFPIDENEQHQALQRLDREPGQPRRYAVRSTGKYLGLREIIFSPPPSEALTYDLFYRATPRPLVIDEYSAGTVTVSSGAVAVTGTSTVFPSNCAGSIIRFSAGTTKPSSNLGSQGGADNPYVFQDVIKSYTGATSITLTTAAPQTFTAVGYTISDPLDIEPNVMLTAVLRAAEAEFSRKGGRQDAPARMELARQALREAMEADSAVENYRGPVLYDPIKRATVTNSA